MVRTAYRQFHDESNTATVAVVLMAEFGLAPLDVEERCQELPLHSTIRGGARYQEDRGFFLRKVLRQLAEGGLHSQVFEDPARTLSVQNHIRRWVPGFEFQFARDLGATGEGWPDWNTVFRDDARLLLVEARHSIHGLPVHLLLVRREGNVCYVMNSATGQDHEYPMSLFYSHLASPVTAGASSFAGRQYLFTGIGVRITREQVR